jgi:hypothetical protein
MTLDDATLARLLLRQQVRSQPPDFPQLSPTDLLAIPVPPKSMALRLVQDQGPLSDREVLEFDYGVRAYAPASETGYWRIRWEEASRRRDTTARSRSDAIAKAGELMERLGRGTATDLARASGADLVAHYLDLARRPARVEHWSERHREEQVRYCARFVLPLLASVPLSAHDPARFLGGD